MLNDTNPNGQEYRNLSEVFRELQEIRYNPQKQIEYQQNVEKAQKKNKMESLSFESKRQ